MGQFATPLFSALLGWVQTAASWLWSLITNSDMNAWIRWLLDHWLSLLMLLCIGGLVLDFIVYLIRWQPYRVWASFLRGRRETKTKAAPQVENQMVYQRKWVYADGSMAVEDVRVAPHEPVVQKEQQDAPIRPTRRVARRATLEQSYNQPVYPPQWRHDQQGDKP